MIQNRHLKAHAEYEACRHRCVDFRGNTAEPLLGSDVGTEGFRRSLRADPMILHPTADIDQEFLVRQ
jgi:hypothetical protein